MVGSVEDDEGGVERAEVGDAGDETEGVVHDSCGVGRNRVKIGGAHDGDDIRPTHWIAQGYFDSALPVNDRGVFPRTLSSGESLSNGGRRGG